MAVTLNFLIYIYKYNITALSLKRVMHGYMELQGVLYPNPPQVATEARLVFAFLGPDLPAFFGLRVFGLTERLKYIFAHF